MCKKYETLWLHNRGTSWKHKNNENKQKNGNSDDPQISRPDLRFASRENSETTQNGAGATPKKNHTNPWGLPPDTIGSSPPCLRICTNELRVCGPNKLKGGEKLSNCKNQQHGCEKLMYTTGVISDPELGSPLRRALSILEKVDQLQRFW